MPKRICLGALVIAACGAPAADPRDQRCFAPPPVPASLDPDVRVLSPVDTAAPIGTAHPFILGRHAANGRWIVGCQARADTDDQPGIAVRRGAYMYEGDDLVPYLFRGGGPGEAIDGLVTASNDDRWLVVIRDGALRLVGGHVIDVAHLAVIGELREDRIAIDRDARSLVSDAPPGKPSYDLGSEIVEGPLHWEPMRRTAL